MLISVSTHLAELYPSYNDKWRVRARIQGSTCLLSESVLFPHGREVWSHLDSGSISSPLALGRDAGTNKEGLTWPSPSTPAFSCFACPLVEMPFPQKEKSRHRSGMLTKWGICWMMTSVDAIFTHWGQAPSHAALELENPSPHWAEEGWCFCPSWHSLLLSPPPTLDSIQALFCLFSFREHLLVSEALFSLLWLVIYSLVMREWWVECDCL